MQSVHFIDEASIRLKAHEAFKRHCATIAELLPSADIQHIGSTAIPGSLTKGDLDLLVSVPAGDFPYAESVLARHYQRNTESLHNEVFASFKNDNLNPPLGIQLTCDEALRREFIEFRDALLHNPSLVTAYNQLKQACQGTPMETYRDRKDEFILQVLDSSHK